MRIKDWVSSGVMRTAVSVSMAGMICSAANASDGLSGADAGPGQKASSYVGSTSSAKEVSAPQPEAPSRVGTVTDWNWYEGVDVTRDDIGFHQKHFSYMTKTGPVVGIVTNIMFTLDAPARVVWKYMKDFNTFEGPFGIKYTESWGDLHTDEEQRIGTRTLRYGAADGTWNSGPSEVVKVIPQNQLTLYETVPSDGSTGGVSPGFHTILFTEFGGKTTVTMVLQHTARLAGLKNEIDGVRQADFGPVKYPHAQAVKWWIEQFPPLLRNMVAEDSDNIALKKSVPKR